MVHARLHPHCNNTKGSHTYLLHTHAFHQVAVIVNDMGELNIDAALISSSRLVQAQEKLVSLFNGCICCALREDLLEEVLKLAKEGKFDYLVIESTGCDHDAVQPNI